jgi:N-methylhydantoinase A/oxoprolinase/acetone carboxylase beta subunit
MLFKITYKTDERGKKTIKSLNLSDALVIKGFPELYRINRLTREHLASYHSNCENKYQTAVGFIVEGEKAKKNAATAEVAAKAKAEAAAKDAAAKEAAAKAAAKVQAFRQRENNIAQQLAATQQRTTPTGVATGPAAVGAVNRNAIRIRANKNATMKRKP